jgi:hypothetical protein
MISWLNFECELPSPLSEAVLLPLTTNAQKHCVFLDEIANFS